MNAKISISTRLSACRQRSNPIRENISSSWKIPSSNINPIKSPAVITIGPTSLSSSHRSPILEPAATSNGPISKPSSNAALRITLRSTVKLSKHSSHSSSTGVGVGVGVGVTTLTVLLLLFIHTNLKSPSEPDRLSP
jgi:hypothetical protein